MRAARDADAIRRRVAKLGNAAATSTGLRRMGSERSADDRANIVAIDAIDDYLEIDYFYTLTPLLQGHDGYIPAC
jgi:hypothetical protein